MDAFDPSVLVSEARTEVLDFRTIKEEELYEIKMPLNQQIGEALLVLLGPRPAFRALQLLSGSAAAA